EIDETVGRINGRFAEQGWSPIRYYVRSLPPAELVALYRQADVALVTPLRDGMNLVAKEYVAAQLENDGVLILSEMACAAEELQEALLVNPLDIESVAGALHRALSMPDDERRARMSALRDRVRANDVQAWVTRFVEAAEAATARARATVASPADAISRRLAGWLAQRPTVALFLDYDGTLTPLAPRPEGAILSEPARQILQQAARTPNLDTVIVSGRSIWAPTRRTRTRSVRSGASDARFTWDRAPRPAAPAPTFISPTPTRCSSCCAGSRRGPSRASKRDLPPHSGLRPHRRSAHGGPRRSQRVDRLVVRT